MLWLWKAVDFGARRCCGYYPKQIHDDGDKLVYQVFVLAATAIGDGVPWWLLKNLIPQQRKIWNAGVAKIQSLDGYGDAMNSYT